MKTNDKTNPLEGKTENGNDEPWLALEEALFDAIVITKSIQNGS